VAPFHNEEGNIKALHHELKAVADALGEDYECVFVNDGSTDRTGAILDEIAASDRHVRIVHMRENQGEAAALSAGFQQARGQIIVTLDGDGQNDPRDIPMLLAKMQEGYPVVTGWRRERQEGYLPRILPSLLANLLIAWVTGIPVHDCGCGLKAYRRNMLAGLSLPKGMHRFLPVILQIPAEAIAEVPVNDRARQTGQSHYGLSRMFSVIRDLLPLHCIHRGSPSTPQSLIGAALVAAVLALLYLVDIELTSRSVGNLLGVLLNAGGVVYLALAYRRIGEFIKAQQQPDAALPKHTAEIGG
jgi:glycosyltransferase involved in cell wall biosynthesis